MHYILEPDAAIPACSDGCAREYCDRAGIPYAGWNGCHEGPDYPEYCAMCGVRCAVGIESECSADCMPTSVGILPGNYAGEYCPHGHALAIDPAELEHAIIEESAEQ